MYLLTTAARSMRYRSRPRLPATISAAIVLPVPTVFRLNMAGQALERWCRDGARRVTNIVELDRPRTAQVGAAARFGRHRTNVSILDEAVARGQLRDGITWQLAVDLAAPQAHAIARGQRWQVEPQASARRQPGGRLPA